MSQENRWLFVVVGALLAAILITGGLMILLSPTEEPSETPGIVPAGRIAFISDEEGTPAVYSMKADGSDKRRISPESLGLCLYPSWSPDGQRVAYWGTEEDTFHKKSVVAGVWVSTADGSEHIQVNQDVSSVLTVPPPIWSTDGTQIAFVAASGPSGEEEPGGIICVARADGSGIERTIPLSVAIQSLVWSPAGDDLLFVSMVGSPDTGTAYRWSGESGEIVELFPDAEAAAWSPDGAEIAIGDVGSRAVLVAGESGELGTAFKFEGVEYPLAVAWSPDGERIAVGTSASRVRGLSFGVYFSLALHVVTLEDGSSETIPEDGGRIHHLNWSPDSSRLLLTLVDYRRRTGSEVPWANLWSYDVASGRLQQLTDEPGFAGLGEWSP